MKLFLLLLLLFLVLNFPALCCFQVNDNTAGGAPDETKALILHSNCIKKTICMKYQFLFSVKKKEIRKCFELSSAVIYGREINVS